MTIPWDGVTTFDTTSKYMYSQFCPSQIYWDRGNGFNLRKFYLFWVRTITANRPEQTFDFDFLNCANLTLAELTVCGFRTGTCTGRETREDYPYVVETYQSGGGGELFIIRVGYFVLSIFVRQSKLISTGGEKIVCFIMIPFIFRSYIKFPLHVVQWNLIITSLDITKPSYNKVILLVRALCFSPWYNKVIIMVPGSSLGSTV